MQLNKWLPQKDRSPSACNSSHATENEGWGAPSQHHWGPSLEIPHIPGDKVWKPLMALGTKPGSPPCHWRPNLEIPHITRTEPDPSAPGDLQPRQLSAMVQFHFPKHGLRTLETEQFPPKSPGYQSALYSPPSQKATSDSHLPTKGEICILIAASELLCKSFTHNHEPSTFTLQIP